MVLQLLLYWWRAKYAAYYMLQAQTLRQQVAVEKPSCLLLLFVAVIFPFLVFTRPNCLTLFTVTKYLNDHKVHATKYLALKPATPSPGYGSKPQQAAEKLLHFLSSCNKPFWVQRRHARDKMNALLVIRRSGGRCRLQKSTWHTTSVHAQHCSKTWFKESFKRALLRSRIFYDFRYLDFKLFRSKKFCSQRRKVVTVNEG